MLTARQYRLYPLGASPYGNITLNDVTTAWSFTAG